MTEIRNRPSFDVEKSLPLPPLQDSIASLSEKTADDFIPVGSRATCDPPPMDTDRDLLGYTHDFRGFLLEAQKLGFLEKSGSHLLSDDGDAPFRFSSLRRDDVNIIVTDCNEFYRRFLAASSVAKRLNLLDKADRIALFQAVLYGNACTQNRE